MEFFVYIIYSEKVDKFYIGQTEDIPRRLIEHNSHLYQNSFTKVASDWKIKKSLSCASKWQAIKIETHIKRNRSRKYVEDFIRFPEIGEKLVMVISRSLSAIVIGTIPARGSLVKHLENF